MIKEIIFYNVGHNGDLHLTREFCRHIMKKINVHTKYAHLCGRDVLKDLQCEYMHIDQLISYLLYEMNIFSFTSNESMAVVTHAPYILINDKIFINTYIGQQSSKFCAGDKRPIFQRHYNMWTEIFEHFKNWGFDCNINNIEFYLPTIEFAKCVTNRFLHLNRINILIANGMVNSQQSLNFNFDAIIATLSKRYPFCNFYVTASTQIKEYNVIDVNEIFNFGHDSNLNEIAYLSTFCDIIVGRSSGPDVFTLIRENICDCTKTYICFCRERELADAFFSSAVDCNARHKILWHHVDTNTIENDDLRAHVINVIETEIKNKYFDKFLLLK